MVTFTKKMVKGIIDIITSEPTKTRSALKSMRIRRDGYAYITNGYIAIRYKFKSEIVPIDDNQEEFVIPASNLVYWYHNAKAGNYLSEISIIDLQTTQGVKPYPSIDDLFTQKLKILSPPEKHLHRFDAKLLEQFCKCAGENKVEMQSTVDGEYVKSLQDEQIDAIIIGLR